MNKVIILAALAFAALAAEPFDPDRIAEAQRKLAEKQRRAATQPAATRPAVSLFPATKPVVVAKPVGITIKPGAPEGVARLLAASDEMKKYFIKKSKSPPRSAHDPKVIYIPTAFRNWSDGYKVGYVGSIDVAKVVQILGDDTAIMRLCDQLDIFMEGVPTKGWTDGAEINLGGTFSKTDRTGDEPVFEMLETRSYTTVLGAKRTLILARPLDYKAWIER